MIEGTYSILLQTPMGIKDGVMLLRSKGQALGNYPLNGIKRV